MAGIFKKGFVHVYYGDGKGKTSAAVGLTARVSGCGGRGLFVQFLKNGLSGELKALKAMDGVDVLEGPPCLKFFKDMDKRERAELAHAQGAVFAHAKDIAFSGEYDLLVLDEIVDTVELGLVSREALVGLLRDKPKNLEIVVTGHSIFPELLDAADYASEVNKIKHPYDKGQKARRGAEF